MTSEGLLTISDVIIPEMVKGLKVRLHCTFDGLIVASKNRDEQSLNQEPGSGLSGDVGYIVLARPRFILGLLTGFPKKSSNFMIFNFWL